MEQTKLDPEIARLVSGGLFLVALVIALPIGIGYFFGGGWGWVAFALILCLFARGFRRVSEDGAVVKDKAASTTDG